MDEKIVEGLEILWNIFVTSLLVIAFSLFLISIVPSFLAGISVASQLRERRISKLDVTVSLFWKKFKAFFWKGVILQVSVIVILCIAYINLKIILQETNPVVTSAVFVITLTFVSIAMMFFLNLMYGVTNKAWNRKLLEQSLLLVFAKLPLVIMLSVCYLLFLLAALFVPQLLILMIGLLVFIHYKIGARVWGQVDPVY